MNAKETLDALLRKNQAHDKAFRPGTNNHVPMVLIALYRLGANSDQMNRYVESFDLGGTTRAGVPARDAINRRNWRDHLGRGDFSDYVDFFDEWTRQTSTEVVLFETLPVLMTGVCTEAYHALLRLGYALDYGSREEVAFALAYWCVEFYPGPDYETNASPVEPETLLAEIVEGASGLQIAPLYSIDGRLHQVYDFSDFKKSWKPVRIADSNPLEKLSASILKIFAESQHFTLLHALTSCQALRLVLPYIKDPRESLTRYWHSVCAAYITVYRSSFALGKDTVPRCDMAWKEIFAEAASSEEALEHKVKLAYTCWLESDCYGRAEYLALACREVRTPSPFV
jgi:hypothetical protein